MVSTTFLWHSLCLILFFNIKLCLSDCALADMKKYLEEARDALKSMRGAMKESTCFKKENDETVKVQPTHRPEYVDQCADFEPVNVNKSILCFLGKRDLDKGLIVEDFLQLKLCTDYYFMLPLGMPIATQTKRTMKIIDAPDDAALAKWASMGVKPVLQIGGSWDDPRFLTQTNLSRIFDVKTHRKDFAESILQYITSSGVNFEGILISWYYPSCPFYDCKVGPSRDSRNLISFLQDFLDARKSKSQALKIALEVYVDSVTLYMGYELLQLSSYVDIFLLEMSCPLMRNPFISVSSLLKIDINDKQYRYFQHSNFTENAIQLAMIKSNFEKSKVKHFMELETISIYMAYNISTPIEDGIVPVSYKNITAKDLCLLVGDKRYKIDSNKNYEWPHLKSESELYQYNELGFIKSKVNFLTKTKKLHGVWMRDFWADDVKNECGCGSFPILRAANEAIGRSKCKLPSCPNPYGSSEMKGKSSKKESEKVAEKYSKFEPSPSEKKIICLFSNSDYERGLNAEKLAKSRLCDSIFATVMHTAAKYHIDYEFSTLHANDEINSQIRRSLGFNLLVHIGSTKSSLSASDLFLFHLNDFGFATNLTEYVKTQGYKGVLISLYMSECIGVSKCSLSAEKEDLVIDFITNLRSSMRTAGLTDAVIALEVHVKNPPVKNLKRLKGLANYILLAKAWSENQFGKIGTENNAKVSELADYYFGTGVEIDHFEYGDISSSSEPNVLLELETKGLEVANFDTPVWSLSSLISNIDICHLIRKSTVKRLSDNSKQSRIQDDKTLYLYNDILAAYERAKLYVDKMKMNGVWLRDLWADGMVDECGNSSFSMLRAANEGIGRSGCKFFNCFKS